MKIIKLISDNFPEKFKVNKILEILGFNSVIKTEVKHSKSKDAWNIVGTELGQKYKIAVIPYFKCDDEIITTQNKMEALDHAFFISFCLNNTDIIKIKIGYQRKI